MLILINTQEWAVALMEDKEAVKPMPENMAQESLLGKTMSILNMEVNRN